MRSRLGGLGVDQQFDAVGRARTAGRSCFSPSNARPLRHSVSGAIDGEQADVVKRHDDALAPIMLSEKFWNARKHVRGPRQADGCARDPVPWMVDQQLVQFSCPRLGKLKCGSSQKFPSRHTIGLARRDGRTVAAALAAPSDDAAGEALHPREDFHLARATASVSCGVRGPVEQVKQSCRSRGRRFECILAAKHAAASVVGFAVDFTILHLAIRHGLEPAWARVVSLAVAVNVTFVVNALFVFRVLGSQRRLVRQWLVYLVTNACGNFCNYWIFVTLVSLHHPYVSRTTTALCIAAFSAWIINYAGARLIVFSAGMRRRMSKRRQLDTPRPPLTSRT